jgi:hypothetical protein
MLEKKAMLEKEVCIKIQETDYRRLEWYSRKCNVSIEQLYKQAIENLLVDMKKAIW